MKTLILILLPFCAFGQFVQYGNTKWSTADLNSGQFFTLQEMEANPCPAGWEVPNRLDWYNLMTYSTEPSNEWLSDNLNMTQSGYSDWAGNIHFAGYYDAYWLSDHDYWHIPNQPTTDFYQYYSFRNLFYNNLKPEAHVYPDINPFIKELQFNLVQVNGEYQIDTTVVTIGVYRYQIRCIQRGQQDNVFHLIKGWSYVTADQNYTFAQFFPNLSNVMLVKNVHGQVYYPQFGVNQIGAMEAGKLYLVRMYNTENVYH